MSNAIITGWEAAPFAPPSTARVTNGEDRQSRRPNQVEPAAKLDGAGARLATDLPPFKAGFMPWVDPLKEARWSVQSLDAHVKFELSGKPTGSGPTLADAGNRVKAALENVWNDPHLSTTLKAQGESREGITNDLSAGHFEKVVTTFKKTEKALEAAYRQGVGLPPIGLGKRANDVGNTEPVNAIAAEPTIAKSEPSGRAGSTTQQDSIIELVCRLQGASVRLTERDAGLARGIDKLAETASADPSITSQAMLRTHVAYSLQDTEKALGSGSVPVPAELRSEMTRLAGTSPALENKQMENLVRSTPGLDDRGLVRDLRRAADSIATLGSNQGSPAAQQHVEVLENRVRLATRVTASEAVSTPNSPVSAQADGATKESPIQSEAHGTTRAVASPGGGQQRPERDSESQPATVQATGVAGTGSRPKTAMAQIMDNLRSPGPSSPPPWAPSTFAMGERVSKFEQMMGHGKSDQLIRASEKSGVVMMKAVETFSTGPGAEILGKIDAAAGTEPGGMKAVMREMQPGGRYAELRSQFDNALQSDKAFAASYSQVEKTAEQHGKDRLALGADFQAKGLETRQLDARFQKADEAIGEATERIPGRTPGKSVMEELGQKVAEIFNKAIERVRAMFGREAAPEARASASPGMSP